MANFLLLYSGGSMPEQVKGIHVSADFFPVFDAIFYAAIFVLKDAREFSTLVVPGDRLAVEEQDDTVTLLEVTRDL